MQCTAPAETCQPESRVVLAGQFWGQILSEPGQRALEPIRFQ
jgi:hypothetical protein